MQGATRFFTFKLYDKFNELKTTVKVHCMAERIVKEAQVPFDLGGNRFDQIATELFNDYSRSRIQSWIKEGVLKVDGKITKPKEKLFGGEIMSLDIVIEAQEDHEAQEMALDVVYEDNDIIIVNKPAGLVVHPAVGNRDGTLMNAILHHAPETAHLPRAGIVHRLDKETTGLMVVAKTLAAQTDLVMQLQERSMGREYEAVSIGVMTGGGVVDEPIGRHPHNRQKQAVEPVNGKDAVTHYRLVERFKNHTHIRLKLETGRTHQIRVHMARTRDGAGQFGRIKDASYKDINTLEYTNHPIKKQKGSLGCLLIIQYINLSTATA